MTALELCRRAMFVAAILSCGISCARDKSMLPPTIPGYVPALGTFWPVPGSVWDCH